MNTCAFQIPCDVIFSSGGFFGRSAFTTGGGHFCRDHTVSNACRAVPLASLQDAPMRFHNAPKSLGLLLTRFLFSTSWRIKCAHRHKGRHWTDERTARSREGFRRKIPFSFKLRE